MVSFLGGAFWYNGDFEVQLGGGGMVKFRGFQVHIWGFQNSLSGQFLGFYSNTLLE